MKKNILKRIVFIFLFINISFSYSQKLNIEMEQKMIDSFQVRLNLLKTVKLYNPKKEKIFNSDILKTKQELVKFIKLYLELKNTYNKSINFDEYTFVINEDNKKNVWFIYIYNHEHSYIGNGTFIAIVKNNCRILISEAVR